MVEVLVQSITQSNRFTHCINALILKLLTCVSTPGGLDDDDDEASAL